MADPHHLELLALPVDQQSIKRSLDT